MVAGALPNRLYLIRVVNAGSCPRYEHVRRPQIAQSPGSRGVVRADLDAVDPESTELQFDVGIEAVHEFVSLGAARGPGALSFYAPITRTA